MRIELCSIVFCALALVPAGIAQAKAVKSCAVLSPDSIKQATGLAVTQGKEVYNSGTNSNCMFEAASPTGGSVSVAVSTAPNQKDFFGPQKNARFKVTKPLEGLGFDAYIWPLQPRQGSVAFLKNGVQIELGINGAKNPTEAQLKALAKAAAAALP